MQLGNTRVWRTAACLATEGRPARHACAVSVESNATGRCLERRFTGNARPPAVLQEASTLAMVCAGSHWGNVMSGRWRVRRIVANLAILSFVLPVSLPAIAFQESLSFRRAADGGLEAVVSGLSDGPSCETEFVPPSDVQVASATIAITSPYEWYFCSIPMTATPYHVVADLGQLSGASYQVTWTEGPLQLSATLVPAGIGPVFAAPTASFWALAMMAVLLVAFGIRRTGRQATQGH